MILILFVESAHSYPGKLIVLRCKNAVKKVQPRESIYFEFLGRLRNHETNPKSRLKIDQPEHILAILQHLNENKLQLQSDSQAPWANLSNRDRTKMFSRAEEFLEMHRISGKSLKKQVLKVIESMEADSWFVKNWFREASFQRALNIKSENKVKVDLLLLESMKVFSYKLDESSWSEEKGFVDSALKRNLWLGVWASLWAMGGLSFYLNTLQPETLSVLNPILLFPAYLSSSVIHTSSFQKDYWLNLQSFTKAKLSEWEKTKKQLMVASKSYLKKEQFIGVYTSIYLAVFSAWYLDSQALEQTYARKQKQERAVRIEAVEEKYQLTAYERARREVQKNIEEINRKNGTNYSMNEAWVLEEIESRKKLYEKSSIPKENIPQ